MDSKNIIDSISAIYEKFHIPPILQSHMLRSAGLGWLISKEFDGNLTNINDIVATLLIHDLGNIAKIDFDSKFNRKLYGDNIGYWMKTKDMIVSTYGKNDHQATLIMAKELGVSDRVYFLLENITFEKTDFILELDDWDLKICAYADYRVAPFGIVSLKERIDDIKRRYKGKDTNPFNEPRTELLTKYTFEIEKEIFAQLSISPSDINNESVEQHIKKHLLFNYKPSVKHEQKVA